MNIKDFTRGWLVGNFEPSLIKTSCMDIGIIHLKKGYISDEHFHKKHTEYNIIISGCALVRQSEVLTEGEVFTFAPFEKSNVEYLEDTTLLVIKSPSTNGDKFFE